MADLQALFLELWNEREAARKDPDQSYFPALTATGGDLVRIVDSRGGDSQATLHDLIVTAVSAAKRRVWVTQAYFAPDQQLLDALTDAARRGVDVRILLPAFSDAPLVVYASRAQYARLLRAGVKIYERTDSVLHAKTMVIDGVWSTVGSSNLDYRSFLHNNEANAVIMGPAFAHKMERLFDLDLEHSRAIDLEAWQHRPWRERLKETFSSLFRYWF